MEWIVAFFVCCELRVILFTNQACNGGVQGIWSVRYFFSTPDAGDDELARARGQVEELSCARRSARRRKHTDRPLRRSPRRCSSSGGVSRIV